MQPINDGGETTLVIFENDKSKSRPGKIIDSMGICKLETSHEYDINHKS